MVQERKDVQNVMRKPDLKNREYLNLHEELGLEMKGLNNLTKQNITKDDKREQKIRQELISFDSHNTNNETKVPEYRREKKMAPTLFRQAREPMSIL